MRSGRVLFLIVWSAGAATSPAHAGGQPTTVVPSPLLPSPSPSPMLVRTVISFSHKAGAKKIMVGPPGDWDRKEVDPSSSPRVYPGTVAVRVRETNTAVYSYDAQGTGKSSDDLVALQTFVGGLKPYLAELASTKCRFSGAWDPGCSGAFPPGSPSCDGVFVG